MPLTAACGVDVVRDRARVEELRARLSGRRRPCRRRSRERRRPRRRTVRGTRSARSSSGRSGTSSPARPTNSGFVGSMPLSTIVIGTPAGGAAAGSAPTAASHHSSARAGRSPCARRLRSPRRTGRARARRRRRGGDPSARAQRTVGSPACPARTSGSAPTSATASRRSAPRSRSSPPSTESRSSPSPRSIDTEPVGFVDQPRFLNGVAALETERPATELLDLLLAVEARFGRDRTAVPPRARGRSISTSCSTERREIDEPGLRIPHPRLHERAFVLGPLAELDPGLEVPGKGPVQTLLSGLD